LLAMSGLGGSGFGCGRHLPGPVPGVYGASRVAPSSLWSVSMAAPAARPIATPLFFAASLIFVCIDLHGYSTIEAVVKCTLLPGKDGSHSARAEVLPCSIFFCARPNDKLQLICGLSP
jgi:hypothetical protein